MKQVKKAVLLAAGFGTRLKPVTDNLPKCLVPINGKPLLQIWLEQLSQAGIEEFLINTHYLPEQVITFIQNSLFKQRVTLIHEPELLGTLGTLKANQSFWENDNVLVAHADNLCLCDWSSFFQRFETRKPNSVGSIMLFETDTPKSCGIVELDDSDTMVAFHEKVEHPPSNLASAAIYIFDENIINTIAILTDDDIDISYHLMPHLMGKMQGWENTGYMRDIGTVASLNQANIDIKGII